MSEAEKRTASVSVRVGPNLKKRLERDATRERAKSTSDFIHTLIEEALVARESAARTPSDAAPLDTGIGEKLNQLLDGLANSEAKTGDILERHEKERESVAQELRKLRDAVTLVLQNVLIQIGEVEPEKARAAVQGAMYPRPPKPPT